MEVVNIPFQATVWFGIVGLPTTLPNLAGFCLFAVLLVEGAGYWLAKLYQLRTREPALPGVSIFCAARVVNPVLLAIGVSVTGYAVANAPGLASWPGLGFALFAVLEHVNCFHVQLMHATTADLRRLRSGGLRRSHLARDLKRPSRRI
ncbi:MAG: hypothetical protein ACRDTM_12640 [Micromonosporaceae bacterium]